MRLTAALLVLLPVAHACGGVVKDPDTGVDRVVRAEFHPPPRETAADEPTD